MMTYLPGTKPLLFSHYSTPNLSFPRPHSNHLAPKRFPMSYTESGKQIGDKANMSYAGNSNVGFPNIYEDSNQKNIKRSEVEEVTRHSGENVKGFMLKDQAGEVNRLYEERLKKERAEAMKKDPTLAATLHNNKPSKGAIIDKEIEEEERAMLNKKKGKSMTGESHY